MRKTRRKVILLLCIFIVLVISIVLYVIGALNDGRLLSPNMLSSNLRSNHENTEYIGELTSTPKIVVHYPNLANESVEKLLKTYAEKLLIKVKEDISKEKEPLEYYNIDFKYTEFNEHLLSVYYDYNQEPSLYDLSNFDSEDDVEVAQYFDDYLKNYVNYHIRALAKQTDNKDYAHTIDFAEKTYNNDILYNATIYDNTIFVKTNDANLENFKFHLPLNEYSSHIALDLGVTQVFDSVNVIPPRYVDPDRPMVAFTFDDGPYEPTTSQIVEEARKLDGAVTFFQLGDRVFDSNQQEVITDIIEGGNEIGSHSVSHANLTKVSDKLLEYEMNAVQDYLRENFNYKVKLFRPPYGAYNDKVENFTRYEIAMWTVDTEDWKYRDAQTVYNNIMRDAKDKSVILLHDIYQSSVDGAILAMNELKKQGYQLVTMSELLQYK